MKKKRELSSRKRIYTEDSDRQTYIFPELLPKNKQHSFRSHINEIKMQNKRMLDHVSKLYGNDTNILDIVKSDDQGPKLKRIAPNKSY